MKIAFTGGGGGGHFYPAIAVAEQVKQILAEQKIIDAELYFIWPENTNPDLLLELGITYVHNMAGKVRLYPSVQNIVDTIKAPFAIIQAIYNLFNIYPDVLFSKGGYGAFPVVFAARLLMIPVIMHESDSVPGRVNAWTGKFARRIAVSYPEASKFFNLDRVAYTGQPIRNALLSSPLEPLEKFDLDDNIPLILVLGGSQGAQVINNVILESLIGLLPDYQIVHQAGEINVKEVSTISSYLLKNNPLAKRYILKGFIDSTSLSYLGNKATLIITRAGSTLFEIAVWGKPSIVIPITVTNGDHQRTNAYSYARKGAASVIEERNLSDSILIADIKRILSDKKIYGSMAEAALSQRTPEAAKIIAKEIINIAQTH